MPQNLRRRLAASVFALALASPAVAADAWDGHIKLGVLTDLSGPYANIAGEGSVVATRMAVDDCLKAECKGMKIDVISADHQNKADVAVAIARRWIDQEKVDAFGDLVNASVQVAIQALVKQENRVALYPGGTTRLTNEDCAPDNSVQWMWDTYSQVAGVTKGLAKPGTKWFFLTADYTFGASLQKDATGIIEAGGGKVVGAVRHPFPSFDFSSFLLQAQSSGADYIAMANAGSDAINTIKQASEFGIGGDGTQKLVALILTAPEIISLGLPTAQNTVLTEPFYWDLDDRTRAWSKRFTAAYGRGIPSLIHAGAYSVTLHYLKAVAAAKTNDPKTVVRKMHELPIEDEVMRNPTLRPDGRMVHDTFLFRVKKPAESKGRDDVYTLLDTIPAAQAFKPLADSACAAIMLKKP